MKVSIQSLHFTSKEQLNDFVLEKVSKLGKFSDKIISGEVCLKLDKSSATDNKVCEIKLHIPGNDLFAKKQCSTFEEATVQVVDALQHQIQKLKINHHE